MELRAPGHRRGAATASPSAGAVRAPPPSASRRHRHRPPRPPASPGASLPPGWTEHDVAARNVIRRYVGNLAPALQGIFGDEAFAKIADMLAVEDGYPELAQPPAFVQVPQLVLSDALTPLEPETDGEWTVFRITIDEIEQAIDELKPTVAALGYNQQTPGPTIRVQEGAKVRAIFTNNLKETTGVHFHGVEFDDFFMDGVPFVTQKPFAPGESFTYEFTANRPGSMMYHSHHNATDQVGRGLLGAFIVDPVDADAPVDTIDRDYVWISNDVLGGFTINGHGFPAVLPILAAVGETGPGPVHERGDHVPPVPQPRVPPDRWWRGTAIRSAPTRTAPTRSRSARASAGTSTSTSDRVGLWAFHCHILPHVEGADGMFGMVNVLIVVPDSGRRRRDRRGAAPASADARWPPCARPPSAPPAPGPSRRRARGCCSRRTSARRARRRPTRRSTWRRASGRAAGGRRDRPGRRCSCRAAGSGPGWTRCGRGSSATRRRWSRGAASAGSTCRSWSGRATRATRSSRRRRRSGST